MEKGRAYAMTIAGASFWGMTGLFVQKLYTFGFTPLEVVTVRMALSAFFIRRPPCRPFLSAAHLSPRHPSFYRTRCSQYRFVQLVLFHGNGAIVSVYCRCPSLYKSSVCRTDVPFYF